MRGFSKQRFGLMGKLNNSIADLIDSSQLTPAEVVMVLENYTVYIKNLVLSQANATRRKVNGNNVEKTGV